MLNDVFFISKNLEVFSTVVEWKKRESFPHAKSSHRCHPKAATDASVYYRELNDITLLPMKIVDKIN